MEQFLRLTVVISKVINHSMFRLENSKWSNNFVMQTATQKETAIKTKQNFVICFKNNSNKNVFHQMQDPK